MNSNATVSIAFSFFEDTKLPPGTVIAYDKVMLYGEDNSKSGLYRLVGMSARESAPPPTHTHTDMYLYIHTCVLADFPFPCIFGNFFIYFSTSALMCSQKSVRTQSKPNS